MNDEAFPVLGIVSNGNNNSTSKSNNNFGDYEIHLENEEDPVDNFKDLNSNKSNKLMSKKIPSTIHQIQKLVSGDVSKGISKSKLLNNLNVSDEELFAQLLNIQASPVDFKNEILFKPHLFSSLSIPIYTRHLIEWGAVNKVLLQNVESRLYHFINSNDPNLKTIQVKY